MRMVFAASIVYVFLVFHVVLLATTAVATTTTPFPTSGVTNATSVANSNTANGVESRAATAALNSSDQYSNQYICYLCRQRNTLMIKWCPLYKDDCHLACLSSTSPTRHPQLYPSADGEGRKSTLGTGPGGSDPDDCYVMKLYPDGRWVITVAVSCKAVAGCYLVCSNGDAPLGSRADDTTPAVARGPPLPRASEFQRCGDQLPAAGNRV
ncbi:hypothetical protein CFC21_058285 [Triticum aestivum]|uniref:Uncharacterized protein n=3 Tax=Triticum TaxID=4564 RepID=A0A9R0T634_TRITD|nr:hypothetical protein CFC21_058285 [Triticum aestivum]VAI07919.1 unnamed protein product [Triticum turgidum subsp. durum]